MYPGSMADSDCIVIMGSNMAENDPVAFRWVMEAKPRRRKRDQTPDHIGLALRRVLLEHVVAIDPDGDQFEQTLLERVLASESPGPLRATAILIMNEYRFAATQPRLVEWLPAGAPNADADEPPRVKHDHEVIGYGPRASF